jgi:hypothetical protein
MSKARHFSTNSHLWRHTSLMPFPHQLADPCLKFDFFLTNLQFMTSHIQRSIVEFFSRK